jgi:hypothetical protein
MNMQDNSQAEQGSIHEDLLAGVRYSLPAMLAEIRSEKSTGAYSMEKMEQKEIGKMFKPQKRRRAKSSE